MSLATCAAPPPASTCQTTPPTTSPASRPRPPCSAARGACITARRSSRNNSSNSLRRSSSSCRRRSSRRRRAPASCCNYDATRSHDSEASGRACQPAPRIRTFSTTRQHSRTGAALTAPQMEPRLQPQQLPPPTRAQAPSCPRRLRRRCRQPLHPAAAWWPMWGRTQTCSCQPQQRTCCRAPPPPPPATPPLTSLLPQRLASNLHPPAPHTPQYRPSLYHCHHQPEPKAPWLHPQPLQQQHTPRHHHPQAIPAAPLRRPTCPSLALHPRPFPPPSPAPYTNASQQGQVVQDAALRPWPNPGRQS